MKVIAATLNVRSGPGTEYRVLQQLAKGTTVVIAEVHGDWAHIDCGWVSRAFLAGDDAVPAPASRLLYTLDGEDPELTAKVEKLRALALVEGIEFTTADFGGVRTEADTAKIMKYRDDDYAVYVRQLKRDKPNATPTPKNTWRKIAPFGSSYHNYGAARDLKVTKHPASFTASKALDRLRTLAPSVGLKTITNDPPHVQLPITLAQARARWEARTK